jgi:peptide/nickel transport system permease protein
VTAIKPEAAQLKSGVAVEAFVSRRTLVARRFARNRLALMSMALLVLMFVAAYALPPLLPYSHTDIDYNALQSPPSPQHWFGTNAIGQDILALILRGMQKSMLIGVSVAVISTLIAATVGSVAGYFGGWRDKALMWIVDLLLVIPSLILIMLITPRTKSAANITLLIVFLAAFGWMISSRMVRGLTMSLREREYVQAARYMGVPSWRIIARHIVPNVASILIIDAALNVGGAILGETGLSFLGFGVQPPDVSLGTLIADVLVLIILCANLIGDGLRDALDPGSASLRAGRAKR